MAIMDPAAPTAAVAELSCPQLVSRLNVVRGWARTSDGDAPLAALHRDVDTLTTIAQQVVILVHGDAADACPRCLCCFPFSCFPFFFPTPYDTGAVCTLTPCRTPSPLAMPR